MKSTRYFSEQVLRKRPYLNEAMCEGVVAAPLKPIVQQDGRVRHWGAVTDARDGKERIRRVAALDDGETLHNAFFDRDFSKDAP
ncbi:MAG: hypothetical protein U1E20_02260 [Methylocystis sp.]|uniref:hypothetical protein n=1 Tax=Methylocystis sp. TaxID=1911079 RepID=UPI00393C66E4